MVCMGERHEQLEEVLIRHAPTRVETYIIDVRLSVTGVTMACAALIRATLGRVDNAEDEAGGA